MWPIPHTLHVFSQKYVNHLYTIIWYKMDWLYFSNFFAYNWLPEGPQEIIIITMCFKTPPTLLMKICAFSFISLFAPEQTLLCELFGVSPKVILSFNVVHILWQIVCVQSHYPEKSKHPKNCKCCPGHSLTISHSPSMLKSFFFCQE